MNSKLEELSLRLERLRDELDSLVNDGEFFDEMANGLSCPHCDNMFKFIPTACESDYDEKERARVFKLWCPYCGNRIELLL